MPSMDTHILVLHTDIPDTFTRILDSCRHIYWVNTNTHKCSHTCTHDADGHMFTHIHR